MVDDINKYLKRMSDEDLKKFYELANWLQYKAVEDNENYWHWHSAIQQFITKYEMFNKHQFKYYDDYFYPYIVVKGGKYGQDYTRKDWERDFPNNYEALLDSVKPLLM